MVKGLHPFFHLRRISFHCKKRFLCFTGEIEEKFPHRYFQFFLYQIGINLKLAFVSGKKRTLPVRLPACFEVNNIRHFIVSNYIEESVLDRNPQLHTTKEDAENHGLGILSVKKVVNQYGGLIDISEENSRFMVHIACV